MLNGIIEKFASNPSSENMDELIKAAKSKMDDNDVAELTLALAKSGDSLKFSKEIITADIPSTGGMSSLSTLICPLVLKELGFYVPKLGIVGRPAGGIDVLYQIPNYKIKFNKEDIKNCLTKNQYCHFLVGDTFAPLDAIFFDYRSKAKAKAIPSLVIASILSKKVAAGLKISGLDVRISPFGNFGINWSEALLNSKRFIRIASLLGIKAVCFLNDFSIIQQPYIGRGESLSALNEIFIGEATGTLQSHLFRCIDMAIELNPQIYSTATFPLRSLQFNFENNLFAQGSSPEYFYEKVKKISECHSNSFVSHKNGFLKIDIGKLRDLLVNYQRIAVSESNIFPDPCGLIFKKQFGEFVNKGELILTYRLEKGNKDDFLKKLSEVITIIDTCEEGLVYRKVK